MVASPLEQFGCMGVTRSYVDDLSGNQAATTGHQVPDSHSDLMHSPGFDGMHPANRFLAIRCHTESYPAPCACARQAHSGLLFRVLSCGYFRSVARHRAAMGGPQLPARSDCDGVASHNPFGINRPPALVEQGLQRAIETQDGVPALAGDRLQPAAFLAGRRRGS